MATRKRVIHRRSRHALGDGGEGNGAMKAFVIAQEVTETPMDHIHGFTFQIHRVLIPDANDPFATVHRGDLYVRQGGFSEYEVVREIDVPDELVERALEFLRLRDELVVEFEGFLQT